MVSITYVRGDKTKIDIIKPLWEQLNSQHLCLSPNFKDYYKTLTFQDRKRAIMQRAAGIEIHVELGYNENVLIGYCISSIDRSLVGEIDSIFVEEKHRNQGIGTSLMKNSLDWLTSKSSKKNIVSVAVGNEQAYGFYAKFGFLPRRTMLEQKKQ